MVTDMTFEMMTKSLRESMSGEGAQNIIKEWMSSIGGAIGILPGKGKEFTEPAANAYRQLDEGKLRIISLKPCRITTAWIRGQEAIPRTRNYRHRHSRNHNSQS